MRSRLMWTAASVLAVSLMSAETASAQQALNLSAGFFAVRGEDARVDGDVITVNRSIYELEVGDFSGVSVGAEWIVPLGEFLEAGAGIGYTRSTVPSVYRDYVRPDGTEIEQDFKLRTVPITATVRVLPLGRGAIEPYVGGGLGIINYRYSETGDFIDFSDPIGLPVFPASYVASGTELGPVAVFGLRFPVADAFAFGGEVRYQKADADLSEDFLGPKLDLGGFHYTANLTIRFD